MGDNREGACVRVGVDGVRNSFDVFVDNILLRPTTYKRKPAGLCRRVSVQQPSLLI